MIRKIKILLLSISLILSACGASGGGTGAIRSGGFDGDPISELGDEVNDHFPGTSVFVTESDNYDVAFQIGGGVIVIDSLTVNNNYEVLNTLEL